MQYFGDSAALAPWINTTGLGEAYGNLRQRNQFATLGNGFGGLVWWVMQGLPAVGCCSRCAHGNGQCCVVIANRSLRWFVVHSGAYPQCGGDRRSTLCGACC
ncbi:pilin glycosylation ligase domain-containing protein [Candidatus Aalborgicola defluviihabitans]|uniref:pilin glycosylation ligase domain-containing protein n=1 Tax=Candidatus Aalborgicola defluviihabitans TaxID=3386187 RepID=UPI0039B9624F